MPPNTRLLSALPLALALSAALWAAAAALILLTLKIA